jgi:hypothetical protein
MNGALSIVITLILIIIATLANAAKTITGGGHQIRWNDTVQNEHDGRETAKSMFGVDIQGGPYRMTDKHGFNQMNVENHRATLSAETPNDVFPEGQRPRGDADIESVRHHMSTEYPIDPIMVLQHDDKMYVLDGVHRLVAAYLTDSPIRYRVYTTLQTTSSHHA